MSSDARDKKILHDAIYRIEKREKKQVEMQSCIIYLTK